MDIQQLQNLLAETKASLDSFQSDGLEKSRIDAQEKALQLARALERPRDAILKLAYAPSVVMAVKIAHDMEIFPVLAKATSPVPLADLASVKPADPLLVERILRLLATNGFVQEFAPREYLPTRLSKEMTERASIGVVESLFLEFLPTFQKTPEYLRATNYRNPDDPMLAALQYTNDFKTDGFTWLCQNPEALTRFNSFMEGQRADRPHWGDWFPVQEQILDHPDLEADTPLLVDIGAGRGHDLIGFKKRFPDVRGKLILEDLPAVIEEVQGAQDLAVAGIDTVSYDFFKQVQPVQGARAYYFKNVLHDWSDEKAAIIFNNLKPAMKPGFSKIIAEEYILPDQNARSLPCMTDMAVMVFCSGLERTQQRWTDLMTSVGLRVAKFWVREGDGLGIIEAELPESA
ncbi:Plant methyltransferase dimerization [Penicillium cataractarum]|uniref:Plant methyltransferase dimerization n=1 Tax=Penicillium cataractarum TaxID=2100454 RepID=A0A9W9UW49_9EURO|nr:Plant methyltransferase dimerization [Penicillium cataractarum]KAJ5358794.1 Plant methyltransferase dimerization [Penicillium cataractarum]